MSLALKPDLERIVSMRTRRTTRDGKIAEPQAAHAESSITSTRTALLSMSTKSSETYVIEGDEIVGGGFGSSQRLMAELCLIAPPLGITLENGQLSDSEAQRLSDLIDDCTDPYETEIMVWLALFEAACLSIHHRTAIHFG